MFVNYNNRYFGLIFDMPRNKSEGYARGLGLVLGTIAIGVTIYPWLHFIRALFKEEDNEVEASESKEEAEIEESELSSRQKTLIVDKEWEMSLTGALIWLLILTSFCASFDRYRSFSPVTQKSFEHKKSQTFEDSEYSVISPSNEIVVLI